MSLISTRRDTAAEPHAQVLLDIATLRRALALVTHWREPHLSITLATTDTETSQREICHRIEQLAATVPTEVWQATPRLVWEHDHVQEPINAHTWVTVLGDHGWTDHDVVEALGPEAHLPWMRFDQCDGCLAKPTVTELLLSLHAGKVI